MNYVVPEESISEFDEKGFTVLDSVIDSDTLVALREECSYFVGYIDSYLDAKDLSVLGITHRSKRYFISNRYRLSPRVTDFLYGSLMETITRAFLGENVYLFNEQWVVKGPEQGMKFAWHQDSGYVRFYDPQTQHKPYISCWCALDDVNYSNGTISVLPHNEVGSRNHIFDHRREERSNDLVGYEGTNQGEEISASAGSIAVFSSTSLHRSSANSSSRHRRVYLAQYTAEPLYASNGKPWAQIVPFIEQGKVVYDRVADMDRARRT